MNTIVDLIADLIVELWRLWDRAGQTAQLAAIVALVSAALAFFTAFVNRRSNRLVARDAASRALRQAELQDLIDDTAKATIEYDRLIRVLVRATESAQRRSGEPGPRTPTEFATEMDWVTHYFDRLISGNRPLAASQLAFYQFPLLEDTAGRLTTFLRRIPRPHVPADFDATRFFMLNHSAVRYALFADLRRAIEHVVFGTSPFWSRWRIALFRWRYRHVLRTRRRVAREYR